MLPSPEKIVNYYAFNENCVRASLVLSECEEIKYRAGMGAEQSDDISLVYTGTDTEVLVAATADGETARNGMHQFRIANEIIRLLHSVGVRLPEKE